MAQKNSKEHQLADITESKKLHTSIEERRTLITSVATEIDELRAQLAAKEHDVRMLEEIQARELKLYGTITDRIAARNFSIQKSLNEVR